MINPIVLIISFLCSWGKAHKYLSVAVCVRFEWVHRSDSFSTSLTWKEKTAGGVGSDAEAICTWNSVITSCTLLGRVFLQTSRSRLTAAVYTTGVFFFFDRFFYQRNRNKNGRSWCNHPQWTPENLIFCLKILRRKFRSIVGSFNLPNPNIYVFLYTSYLRIGGEFFSLLWDWWIQISS